MAKQNSPQQRLNADDVIAVIRRVLSENGRAYLGSYIVAVACLVMVAGATAYLAWIIRDVVDKIFYQDRKDLIALLSASIFTAFLIRGLASYGAAVLLARVGNNIIARYQDRIFDKLMALGMGFFASQRSGQLVAQVNQNTTGVRDLMTITLTSLARDAMTLIGLVAVMFYQDPLLSSVIFVIGPPLGFGVNYLMKKLRRVTRQSVEINSRLLGAMQEAVQGISIVKAFTMEEQLRAKLSELIQQSEHRSNRIAEVSERVSPVAEILAGILVSLAIAYTGFRTLDTGELPGSMVAFVTAMMLAYDPARRLARVQVGLERALVNARMIYEIIDLEPHQPDRADAVALAVGRGEIRFENVTFGYGPDVPVIRSIDLTAKAGETTAIVGSSGAGKTTLIALVQRFWDPEEGRVLIDGQDIAAVTKSSLRQAIAYVSQQPYLFEGTIRDNIRYGRADATDGEIEAAARAAHAEDFILAQPQGYDTPVGESGSTLSGGQRQRLSIARAIVRNAPILLLDEATSALDNESEKKVQLALEEVMKGRTTIVIAHRLSTVVNADRIVVMDQGVVVEEGTHDELVRREGGLYKRFHDAQMAKPVDLDIDEAGTGEAEGGKR
ncbi:MAG: ABC transporter ATP-binding protein [Zhengella sp.]|uniref:ABC transporter ATP-binding protein n=1 Tax=Zhengella sp. TaxID=2282762 RepID=UPI001DED76D5|nr:ABC transporter ATP-binding protein [Notoacmeibacter sp.]MCC0025795.1 ABC transporter ATP-binding protein [Brucellaceae bacterium]